MELTLEEALKGKATRIKNKDYFETKAYLEPFIERMSKFTNDFRVNAILPDQITKTKTGEIDMDDITFNRLWIQAVLPGEFAFNNHQEVVGMVYGLDVKKPIVKIYRGGLNMACLNLCVFQPEELNVQELEPERPIDFSPIKRIMENTCEMKAYLERLDNTEFVRDKQSVERELGRWINNSILKSYDNGFGKVKLATSLIIDAYKNLFINEESDYFVEENTPVSMFTVYNSFTDQICNKDKDIMNKAEKTLLLKSILEF